MTTQQDAYTESWEDLTKDNLMELTLSKYNMLEESNKWNAPLAQDSEMVFITAKADALRNNQGVADCVSTLKESSLPNRSNH